MGFILHLWILLNCHVIKLESLAELIRLCLSQWSAVTKCHSPGGVNTRHLFRTNLEDGKSQIKVPTVVTSGESLPCGLKMAVSSHSKGRGFCPFLLWGHIMGGSPLLNSPKPGPLPKAPSPHTSCWGSGHEHTNLGGPQTFSPEQILKNQESACSVFILMCLLCSFGFRCSHPQPRNPPAHAEHTGPGEENLPNPRWLFHRDPTDLFHNAFPYKN